MTADDWIEHLDLEPHPEGGAYRETYRADLALDAGALPERFGGARDAAAHIYFLLRPGDMSALHRIRQDEIWNVYAGGPATLHVVAPDGSYRAVTLGQDVAAGQALHAIVPAGAWFGATVEAEADAFLAGCTTAPAFDFADFELADREALTEHFPQHDALIQTLTR